jgi:serine/threonine protein kinase
LPPPRVVDQPLAEQEPLPERIGRFRIRRLLGAGAFGQVYLADDPVLDRPVALKVLRSDAPGGGKARERFLREAKAAAQLHHPNIVPVFDAGTDGAVYYLAAEYIQGRTLDDALRDHQQDWNWAADVCRPLGEALAYAHGLGIVHRDVKSSNVMIDDHGEVHLMDFGLARRLQSGEKLAKDGAILGTAAYMAPEQASSDFGPVGPCSDQYSLGIVLYELLCGEPPFSGPVAVVLHNCLHTEPAAPHTVVPAVPRDLEAICLKAIAKRPEDRYDSCAELVEDLRRWRAGEPIAARPIGPAERLGRWARRNPWIAGLAAAAAMLMLIVGTVALDALRRVTREERVLAGLAHEKQSLDDTIAIAKRETDELNKVVGHLKEQNEKQRETNSEKRAEIERQLAEVQRKVRQQLREFIEQEPKKWIFSTADDSARKTSDASVKSASAQQAPLLAVAQPPEAVAGQPFGVGFLSVQFGPDGVRWRSDEPLRLSGRGDTVFYPAYTPLASRVNAPPHTLQSLDIHFLFRGREPLELTLEVGRNHVLRTKLPVADSAASHASRMDQWWTRYVRPSCGQAALTSSPPAAVHTYLVRMLAHRLGRRVTPADAAYLLGPCDGYLRAYGDLLHSKADDDTIFRLGDLLPRRESIERNWQYEAWDSPNEFRPYEQAAPLPQAAPQPGQAAAAGAADAGWDELAKYVPRECYYARFANPEDAALYVLRLQQVAGNLPLIGAAEGLEADIGLRLLRQLGLDSLTAGRGLMTMDLISDLAIIGTDAYFLDGAAIGVLVKAKDSELSGALLQLLREVQTVGAPDVEAKPEPIAGQAVSYLRTNDGSVRSFYATRGDVHLISNSRYIVRRFLEAGGRGRTLADDPRFQEASGRFRGRRASLLLYVSEDFWRQLLGAPSVIETWRRYRARAELDLVRWARRTAAAEAIPHKEIKDLIDARLLPESVVQRPDKSLPQMDGGALRDSLRGLPGTFVPIVDVIEQWGTGQGAVSAFEGKLAQAHAQGDSYATSAVRRLGPLVVMASLPEPGAADGGSICLDVEFAFPLRELLARAFEERKFVDLLGPGHDLRSLLRPPVRRG